ncbi:MAG: endonuclease III [Chloroflexi bacterium]|nr:endonuclease III [Chloroflexota bacterium]MDA1145066.1 endonuclease III [Chloroflexota bacterium]MQC82951.1 endonuclease III [Chloroflexota bacterium]
MAKPPTKPTSSTAARRRVRKAEYWTPSELIGILGERYGRAPQQASHAPVFELVLTLLSQHTSDHNSGHAMHRLIEAYPTWEAILAAPIAGVEDAIRPGGLAPTKSKRLQALLAEVKERVPDWELDFLADLPLEEAKRWLTSLPGVGPKTAACVLLFSLERPALPVDTHVERVAKRLGLVPAKMPAVKAHDALEALLTPDEVYAFHVDLIQHGRRTCHARGPKCVECPLLERCPRVGLPPL